MYPDRMTGQAVSRLPSRRSFLKTSAQMAPGTAAGTLGSRLALVSRAEEVGNSPTLLRASISVDATAVQNRIDLGWGLIQLYLPVP
jgi:hypothetical protein